MKKFVKDVLAGFEDAIAYVQGDKSRGVLTTFTIPDRKIKQKNQHFNPTLPPIHISDKIKK